MFENSQDEEWVGEYNDHKNEKALIKEELLSVAWHPDRVIDWCFSEDEKQAHQRN